MQGEDEIASIGFCLGASMAGLKAMTATSGPGITRVDVETLNQQLLALPGAVVDLNSMTVAYPGDVLFAPGSALPFPGGMEILEPLMNWMLQSEEIYGEARVRSAGHADDYDRTLAEKRRELLERLFRNRGVTSDRLQLLVDESVGAPLEIRFQLSSPATSSGGNS